MLFNLVIDVLTRMLVRDASYDLVKGLCSHLIPGVVICLQYVDGTILFIDNDVDKAAKLKTILTCFENVSGMRINYSKSEIIPIGLPEGEIESFQTYPGLYCGYIPHKIFRHPSTL